MQENIRSFIAIEIPDDLKNQIENYLSDIKKYAPKLKWIRKDALHITIKFLGNQPPARIENVINSLLPLHKSENPFDLIINELGTFPNKRKPRVFWLGLEAKPRETFFNLFNSIEQALDRIGFEREKRKFSPHLTVARVKFPIDFSPLWDFVSENPFPSKSFTVNEFVLMRSFLKPSGAEYRVIQKYPLR